MRFADPIWETLSVAGVSVAVLDAEAAVVWCNATFADLAERAPEEMAGKPLAEALSLERSGELRTALGALGRGEPMHRVEVETVDWAGTHRTLALSGSPTAAWSGPELDTTHVVVVAENLTSERRGRDLRAGAAIDAARRATEDGLTGLPNRSTFDGLLESSLRRATRSMVPLAVMSCDLDGFSVVNERLGDAAGDELLQAVASRLTHTLRHHDVLARFTGDEFLVIAEEVGNEETAHMVARRLAAAIAEPISAGGVDVRIGVSIGFTLASGHERPTDLLAEAERAMRGAKRAGKGRSMSLSQVIAGTAATPTVIDWNELALTAVPE